MEREQVPTWRRCSCVVGEHLSTCSHNFSTMDPMSQFSESLENTFQIISCV